MDPRLLGSGKRSASDSLERFSSLEQFASPTDRTKRIADLFSETDIDGDGKISLDEFQSLCEKLEAKAAREQEEKMRNAMLLKRSRDARNRLCTIVVALTVSLFALIFANAGLTYWVVVTMKDMYVTSTPKIPGTVLSVGDPNSGSSNTPALKTVTDSESRVLSMGPATMELPLIVAPVLPRAQLREVHSVSVSYVPWVGARQSYTLSASSSRNGTINATNTTSSGDSYSMPPADPWDTVTAFWPSNTSSINDSSTNNEIFEYLRVSGVSVINSTFARIYTEKPGTEVVVLNGRSFLRVDGQTHPTVLAKLACAARYVEETIPNTTLALAVHELIKAGIPLPSELSFTALKLPNFGFCNGDCLNTTTESALASSTSRRQLRLFGHNSWLSRLGHKIGDDIHHAGHDIDHVAQQVGHGLHDLVTGVCKAANAVGKTVGHAFTEVADTAEDFGKAVYHAVLSAVEKCWKCMYENHTAQISLYMKDVTTSTPKTSLISEWLNGCHNLSANTYSCMYTYYGRNLKDVHMTGNIVWQLVDVIEPLTEPPEYCLDYDSFYYYYLGGPVCQSFQTKTVWTILKCSWGTKNSFHTFEGDGDYGCKIPSLTGCETTVAPTAASTELMAESDAKGKMLPDDCNCFTYQPLYWSVENQSWYTLQCGKQVPQKQEFNCRAHAATVLFAQNNTGELYADMHVTRALRGLQADDKCVRNNCVGGSQTAGPPSRTHATS